MKKILVFQHVAHELLGTLDPLLRDNGFRIKYVNFSRYPDFTPDLSGYDGLIILGGPMNVDQEKEFPHLRTEIAAIETALEKNMPVLGICLGAQLIAKTLGAPVTKNPQKEIGWYDLSLTEHGITDPHFTHFAPTEKIFQWHGDTFAIPRSAVHLAVSPTCQNQGFRYGERTYGFQFHLEVDASSIHRWLNIPANRQEVKDLHGPHAIEQLHQSTAFHIDRLKDLSTSTFSQFISLFGPMKKRRLLPSK